MNRRGFLARAAAALAAVAVAKLPLSGEPDPVRPPAMEALPDPRAHGFYLHHRRGTTVKITPEMLERVKPDKTAYIRYMEQALHLNLQRADRDARMIMGIR